MKSRLLPLFLVLPMTLWAAGPDPFPPSPFCAAVAALPAPASKDETSWSAAECTERLEPRARALQNANGVTVPVSARVVLQAPAPLDESERVRIEFEVYFHFFDANPSVQGLDKIDNVVERLNATWRIESVALVGRQDPVEAAGPEFGVARRRVDNLAAYLRAAGVPSDVKYRLSVASGTQPNTTIGHAQDRVVHVAVSVLRRKGEPDVQPALRAGEESARALRAKEERLIGRLRSEIAALSGPPGINPESTEQARARETRRASMQALLDEFEYRRKWSRTRYVYPRTEDPLVGGYYAGVKQRIETEGTDRFPKSEGRSVYGKALLQFTLWSDGHVSDIEALQSSSQAISDHAIGLIRSLAPFDKFPADIAEEVDRLVIIAPFSYKNEAP
jgi:outer membrane biosynthesis protein TonB/outer membrane protein OmpA-like peptidoglycan-associated protein